MSKYSVVKALLGPKSDREVIEGVFDQYVFDLDENEFYISPKEMAENFFTGKESRYIYTLCFEVQRLPKYVNNPNYDSFRLFAAKYIHNLVDEKKSKT